MLDAWQPHLVIIDLDIGGELEVRGMKRTDEGNLTRIPFWP
jgi:hypothetical protein